MNRIVIITKPNGERAGYLTRNKSGQPTCITGSRLRAFVFTGSVSIDLVTPEHAGQYFCQEHRGHDFERREEYDFGYVVVSEQPFYCFNDGRLADTFDTEADAASYVRDHGGYYASDLTEAEEDLVASDRAERRANP